MNEYATQTHIQEEFGIGSTWCTTICRLIDSHPEIYGEYARLGTQYSRYAFIHAWNNKNALENGEEPTKYDRRAIHGMLDYMDAAKEQAAVKLGELSLRMSIVDQINDWFRVTEIPKNLNLNDYARIARSAMLAIVAGGVDDV